MLEPWLIVAVCTLQVGTSTVVATSTAAAREDPSSRATHDTEVIEEDAGGDGVALARSLLQGVDVHAFVSQGYFRTTTNEYLGKSTEGSFAYTEVGVNFTAQLADRLSTGIQFFGRVLGSGDLSAQFDWFYLDYHFSDYVGIRVGRVKLPLGLYNEFSDIDAARVPILLPQSIYPTQNRDFLLAETGGEIYGRLPLAAMGSLYYRAYGGTIVLDRPSSTGELQVDAVRTPYIVGGRLLWDTPLDGLRLAGSVQALRFEFDVTVPPAAVSRLQMMGSLPADFRGKFEAAIPALLWLVSAEYIAGDLLVAAEYGRWAVAIESDLPALVPSTESEREQFYLMVNYVLTDWLHPGAYYSVLFADVAHRGGRAGSTQDACLTLRFDILSHWIAKVEGHYLNGTAILSSALNGGTPQNQLDREWFLFMVNTTLFF